MKQSSILYILSTALVAFVLATTTGLANGAIEVHEETDITVGLFESKDFNIDVTNDGIAPMTMYVNRTENTLPDIQWFSTICMAELCYAPDVSITDAVTIQPGSTYKVKFTVYTGDVPSTGTFQLKVMQSTSSGDSELGTIDFRVVASEDNSVKVISTTDLAVVPTPAAGFVNISGIAGLNVERVDIIDATGAVLDPAIAVDTDRIRVDVSTLSTGSYFFRIFDGEAIRTGRFIVSR